MHISQKQFLLLLVLFVGIGYAVKYLPVNSGNYVAQVVSSQSRPGRISVTTSPAKAPQSKGTLKILAVVTHIEGEPYVKDETIEGVKKILFTSPDSIASYYKEVSFGKLVVTGDVAVNNQYGGRFPIGLSWDDTFERIVGKKNVFVDVNELILKQGYNPAEYDFVIYVLPKLEGWAQGLTNDWVTIGADTFHGSIVVNGIQPPDVYAHEIGHALGLHHANGYSCIPCVVQGYEDPIDVMGAISYSQFDPYRKNSLGWISSIDVSQSGMYQVQSTEQVGTQLLKISKNSSGFYYPDYRSPTGFDKELGPYMLGGIHIKAVAPDVFSAIMPSEELKKYPGVEYVNTLYLTDNDSGLTMLRDGYVFNPKDYGFNNDRFHLIQTKHTIGGGTMFIRFDEQVKNLKAESAGIGKLKISWGAVSAPSGTNVGYNVYRGGMLIYSGSELNYIDIPSSAGPYRYSVQAYDTLEIGNPVEGLVLITKKFIIEPVSRLLNIPSTAITSPVYSDTDSVDFYTYNAAGQKVSIEELTVNANVNRKLYWRSNAVGCEPVMTSEYMQFLTAGAANNTTGFQVTTNQNQTFKIQCDTASAEVKFTAPPPPAGAGRWF